MSSSTIRSQLERKRAQKADAEKKASAARTKENAKRADATKARTAASKTSSESTRKSRSRDADRYEQDANTAGKDAAAWQTKASKCLAEEVALQRQMSAAEASELRASERKRQQTDTALERQRAQQVTTVRAETGRLRDEMAMRFDVHERAIADLRQPKKERLRILILTSSGRDDLRVGREQKQIQDAVRFASGRDQVRLDVRPAATGADLLNGLTQGTPHVVHFSGHGNEDVIVFEEDVDAHNDGHTMSGRLLGRALQAVDETPLLVVLNACRTAAQAYRLTESIAAFAIGHSDSIGDSDAINYAARFYASIADGQSIGSSHDLAKTALEMMGLPDHDLPQLHAAEGYNPYETRLVLPELPPDA
ncbi:CHAT domain-containing protein [Frigoribacterium sp. PhB160]|uniref:CHAT domain-containing protein n=1 Tax=Frigoribacterium sp. PhB160 TaxID=2485192 RepID=UPI000F48AFDF|nr:CHAT domain-containing protein [Frigoribacterium sp. PhB160]ROS58223.1 CHAT domain-containing protein [Frigoribacterium sp. PhB160]